MLVLLITVIVLVIMRVIAVLISDAKNVLNVDFTLLFSLIMKIL